MPTRAHQRTSDANTMLERSPRYFNLPAEPQVLLVSIWATFGMSLIGVFIGLVAGSQAIIFDGIFALIDASMTVLSLLVARLLAREGSNRFQYGYWHLEPLVAAFNGSVLLLLCLYALLNAIRGLIEGGGHEVSLNAAAVYSIVVCAICFVLLLYQHRANKRLNSELIRIDMNSFIMSASITLALFAGFALAATAERAGFAGLRPYADSLVLLLLALGLLPLPITIVLRAMRDVFLIAPTELHAQVREVMARVVAQRGMLGYKSYVAKTGRMHLVEIHVLVPSGFVADIDVYDRIRQDISDGLGPNIRLEQWLSISFTARADWT